MPFAPSLFGQNIHTRARARACVCFPSKRDRKTFASNPGDCVTELSSFALFRGNKYRKYETQIRDKRREIRIGEARVFRFIQHLFAILPTVVEIFKEEQLQDWKRLHARHVLPAKKKV